MKITSTLYCAVGLVGLVMFAASAPAAAANGCMLIADLQTGKTLSQNGTCDARYSPASSFKIPLSLMGYDAGILVDAKTPAWPYKDEYKAAMESWRVTTNPTTWLEDSIVWFSQVLTRTMGADKFRSYVEKFQYGNRDIAGDAGRDNGLTNSWLSSSLQISPTEQVTFVRAMLTGKLPVSTHAVAMTKSIMPSFPTDDDWAVYGKTGTGFQRGADGKIDRTRQLGWFVGWAERKGKTVIFAQLVLDDEKNEANAGPRARAQFIEALPKALN